ncbi:MAG: DNRLRE domain-containing protein [Xanthomonadales bacterium]|nr:DNRLRE domain-containing protein [Xanthomonadales bacterium]
MKTPTFPRATTGIVRGALLLGCAVTAGPGLADTATINPSYDAYATAGDTGSFSVELRVRDGSGGGANQVRSYLRFDLSSIPEGSTINSANLKLYMTEAPTKQSGGPSVPVNASQDYVLYKSTNVTWTSANDCLYDGAGVTCANPSAVPVSTNLVTVATGVTANVDLTWTGANLQTAVQQSLDSVADNDWISLVVSDDVASQYRALFASNETAANSDQLPRLTVDYTPPAEVCQPGDEELRLTRNDYDGPNPIMWEDAYGDHWFTITFEVDAICADFTDIKVQGGVASNLRIWDQQVSVGAASYKSVGKGNRVITWSIPQLLASDAPAELWFDVSANFNEKGKAACGVKNLTGDWSVIGWWDDAGFPTMETDQAGQLVVDIGCPTP